MLLSREPLFVKKRPGFSDIYAHAAAPSTVVFPPPLGPISAVTGKSNLIVSFLNPRIGLRVSLTKYFR